MSANAYNLARRLSIQNENDLMQENMATPVTSPSGDPYYTRKTCFDMLSKVCPDHPLPLECERFEDVAMELKRRNSDASNHVIAFKGMSGPEAEACRAARARGDLNHHQLQRRLTNPRKWYDPSSTHY